MGNTRLEIDGGGGQISDLEETNYEKFLSKA